MAMTVPDELEAILRQVTDAARRERKLTGFCIGNTRKVSATGWYFSPIRNTARLVAGSVIVDRVSRAADIARHVDGRVRYVLVDTEKKISPDRYETDDIGNVERAVRDVVRQSTILTYKGNDVTVESIDCLLAQLVADPVRGVGGRKVAIVGAGNLGSKLALKLVERGAHVVITRRDRDKLEAIARALNVIKPQETIAEVSATTDNEEAARNAEILIGMTNGVPAITASMIDAVCDGAIVMDGGKGCLFAEALARAEARGLTVLRVDIRAGFEGQVAMLLETERIQRDTVGRRRIGGVDVVSGGLLARKGEIVVDNIHQPRAVYGIADGLGDFVRSPSPAESQRLAELQRNIDAGRGRSNA